MDLKAAILRGPLRRARRSPMEEEPPPPYSPRAAPPDAPPPTAPRLQLQRPSISGPSASEPIAIPSSPRDAYSDAVATQARSSRALPDVPRRSVGRSLSPRGSPLATPAYVRALCSPQPQGPASLATLPLDLLHHILALTLDPLATPEHYLFDVEIERLARIAGLFKLRAVDRRFFLIATAVLRDKLLPTYRSLLAPGASSDPSPPGDGEDPSVGSVFARRTREAAVLDRFIALRIGEDWRKAESELCEDLGLETEIFSGLQPAARMEDLLLTLPAYLITPTAPPKGELYLALPLPHPHLAINVSPLWAQLWIHYQPVFEPVAPGKRVRRILALEVRRGRTSEDTVQRLKNGLDAIRMGRLDWGQKVEN